MNRPSTESARDLVAVYRRLSPPARAGVWTLLGAEVVLIAAAERDIQRRAPDRIRGPKWLWRMVATQNVIGPAAYFGVGRRSSP